MIFGPRPPREAEGGTLAHSVRANGVRILKGTVLGSRHVEALRDAGVTEVEIAMPEPGDVGEDAAAARCARALAVDGAHLAADAPTTGRVNLRALEDGLFVPSAASIDALNAVDPRLTVATLPEARVARGELVATVKIIPFHVREEAVARWMDSAAGGGMAMRVAAWGGAGDVAVPPDQPQPIRACRVAHISTELPTLKPSVMDKTRRVLAARLEGTGAVLLDEVRVPHERGALSGALDAVRGANVILVFGASAVTDAADVVPGAVERAGGVVERVGMPVDPGNLLVLARLGGATVLGAPGCARSPARNGFDIVLDRALAGVSVTGESLARMGVGGLLKEGPDRPRPRETASDA